MAEYFGSGLQIGLINVVDEHDGVPIGLISYVDEEEILLDFWADGSKFLNFGLRTGTETFRNVLFIGSNELSVGLGKTDADRKTIGFLMSRHFYIGSGTFFDIDMGVQHIMDNEWSWDLNQIYQVRLIFGKEFSNNLAVFAGPTINYFRSRVNNGENLAAWTFN